MFIYSAQWCKIYFIYLIVLSKVVAELHFLGNGVDGIMAIAPHYAMLNHVNIFQTFKVQMATNVVFFNKKRNLRDIDVRSSAWRTC
jgi:hypothetical protein